MHTVAKIRISRSRKRANKNKETSDEDRTDQTIETPALNIYDMQEFLNSGLISSLSAHRFGRKQHYEPVKSLEKFGMSSKP